ncbi:MAG: FAD-binding oxidoreductase [Chloroflexota bacterium]|nr:FAD-binding oxidoreductase [Chloroflexota bacterium]
MTVTISNPAGTALDDMAVDAFAATFRGQIIQPDDFEYDGARAVWNGMIDKYPALIVRCTGTADVVAAVNFARGQNLGIAVRGNGHNVAGNAVRDGGLVIDLSRMKGIQIDPVKRVARAQPGVRWGDLDPETQRHGLVTPGGEVSTTGIAGYTLGGGMGMLQRKWGLACDNLLSAEVVTASGEVVRASITEHPDLYWAIRGGGGNFGIVTWFEFQLHPLGPEVFTAMVAYPFADAASVVRAWADFTRQAPDEVTSEALLWRMLPLPDCPPEWQDMSVVLIGAMYAGPAAEGERALQPLRELGTPLIDLSGPVSYVDSQKGPDPLFPDGALYYWKSLFLDQLDGDLIDAIIAQAARRPTPQTLVILRHLGGAIGRVPEDATAYGNRDARYNLSLDASWDDPALNDEAIAWTRRAWSDLHDRAGGGVYLNFAGLGEDNGALARAGYGGNYGRLREIKRKYDPANLFRGNINIAPAATAMPAASPSRFELGW